MDKVVIHTDGGARGNPGPAGIGVVFFGEQGKIIREFKAYIGEATNNVAEYKALIVALEQAHKLGFKNLEINMDSELIVRQMQGVYKIKEPGLQALAKQVLVLTKHFDKIVYQHVVREKNKEADRLVNQAIDTHLGV